MRPGKPVRRTEIAGLHRERGTRKRRSPAGRQRTAGRLTSPRPLVCAPDAPWTVRVADGTMGSTSG